MPGMSWSSLRVVAVDGIVGERGVALRTPILRSETGMLLLPAKLDAETVTPRQVLGEEEVSELLDSGVWIPVCGLPAKRDHIVVVRSESFGKSSVKADIGDDLPWEDHHDHVDIAYVERSVASSWRRRCAERFVKWAERRIGEHLGASGTSGLFTQARMMLEQALFVTNQDTPVRRRVFVLFGVVLMESEPSTWLRLSDVMLFESPELSRAQLDEDVEAARRELTPRKLGRRQAWAPEREQRPQPPGL
jgi:hypothetical protein